MAEKVRSSSARQLLARRCVRCGYDGITPDDMVLPDSIEPLAGCWPARCPNCDCDFTQRPPRSYAEMEGLLGEAPALESVAHRFDDPDESSLIQRWLAFLFLVMLMFVAMIYLTAAAFELR